MSKKVTVAGKDYDSRTIVTIPEKLKLPNHPRVNALAIPRLSDGKLIVTVKIPFGNLEQNTKELRLVIQSPRRIDAINKVMEAIKLIPMYRRTTA